MGRSLTLVLMVSVLLEEDGRKQMTSDVTQNPNHVKSFQNRMDTKRLLSVPKRVICVTWQCPSNARTGIQQGSYENIHQVSRVSKTIKGLLICWVLWTQERDYQYQVFHDSQRLPGTGAGRVLGWGGGS